MTNKIKTTVIGQHTYTESLVYEIKLTEKFAKMLALQHFGKIDSPVTPEEFLVLDVTSCNSDICQRDLAKLLIKDRANTGRLLESLEKKELIKRVVDVKNNRLVKRIVLTEEGKKVHSMLLGKITPICEKAFENFTENEIENTKRVLKKIRDTFQEIVELQI